MHDSEEKLSMKKAFALNMRAFRIWCQYYPDIFISSGFQMLFEVLVPYVGIYFSARIIDELSGARNVERLKDAVLLTVITTAVLGLFRAVLIRWKNKAQGEIDMKLAKILGEKFLSMDFCSVDDEKLGISSTQVMQNSQWSGWGMLKVIWMFDELVKNSFRILGAIALTISLFTSRVPDGAFVVLNRPLFSGMIMLLLLAITLLSPFFANKAAGYWSRQDKDATLGNRVFGFFGFRIGGEHSRALDVRIYRQQELALKYFNGIKIFTPGSKIANYAKGNMGILSAISAAISGIFVGGVYVFVCLKAWAGAFGIGSVTQYIGAITALSEGVSGFVQNLGTMQANGKFLLKVFEFLDTPNNMYQGSLTTEKRSDRKYQVEFRDVSFRYPGTEVWALRHVSMKFQVGERMAVVGENGSGKTTFIKLLCRLYDPTEGQILLNGIDIRKYRYDDYINIFSVVFQDFQLLAFPLGENVAAGVHYDRKRVEDCLKKAGFGERLRNLPKGLDTYLYKDFGEDGVEVSGGEAQKIAIARAIYKDAPFMILDDSTAALDPIAEAEIYSKFNEIAGDKTAIYISHRLSSCRFCDEIVVFDKGNVVQQGSHEGLLQNTDGKYSKLWNAQAQYYTEEKPCHCFPEN